ncbi:hypothetical protein PV08_04340 [Exophiala spinifera]|uniref:SET domain-containing protein n=1 Tax=Exophiala spinifera TaxID=91928 RepID=A0A0D2C0I3_9EURO|nr:uncharacterized protein PV08_04340 [Exophiala spinifera]KIW17149.1 hypothetical protein PV08_04340 [Exophiala spinifera]
MSGNSALFVLAQALFISRCFSECVAVLERSMSRRRGSHWGHESSRYVKHLELKQYAERALRHEERYLEKDDSWRDSTEEEQHAMLGKGDIRVVPYPWIPKTLFRRSESAISRANKTLQDYSQDSLVIRTSSLSVPLRSSGQIQHGQDAYGIFAMRDLPANTKLFLDKTILCASNGSAQCTACCADLSRGASRFQGKRYCDRNCFRDLQAACGVGALSRHGQGRQATRFRMNGFQPLLPDSGFKSVVNEEHLLFQRAVEVAFHSTKRHPGQHPLQARMLRLLTARYHHGNQATRRYSYAEDVCRRIEFLQQLGVDIFQDELGEAWVLETLANRIQTNFRGYRGKHGDEVVAVNTMYAFFNHSCVPNVTTSHSRKENSAICMTTTRRIARGEELYINYLSDEDLDESHDVREEKLQDWTGGMCLCVKCTRERNRRRWSLRFHDDEG